MKVSTTFWNKEEFSFAHLLYINNRTKEVAFQADLNNAWNTYLFFKNISQFVLTKKVLMANVEKDGCYQFAVLKDGEITPIKWFDLMVSDTVKIHHDIAFETTLIYKNDNRLSFGDFPMRSKYQYKVFPKYREYNIKSRAYKYMGNQVRKNLL